MNEKDLYDSNPATLAKLLEAGEADHGEWGADELGAILWFQLAAPLAVDLGKDDARLRAKLAAIQGATQPAANTFHDLLHHPAPPVELLEMVKEFAKAARSDAESRLPMEVSTVLYFAAIAVGLERHRTRLTELDDAALRSGAEWVRAQVWVDEATKSLVLPLQRLTTETLRAPR